MPSASEAAGQQKPMKATLDQGLELLSAEQTVTFTQYQKIVLAQDGFVFWVATALHKTVKGSLHYATDRHQDDDQTIGANQIILSSEAEITEFNLVSPLAMWIGSWPLPGGAPALQIAFSQRGGYYKQADLWHYTGFAVYPALSSQIVASVADLPTGPIVSNSMPIWIERTDFYGHSVPVYPAFLVPDNIAPPYVVADITDTEPLQAAPYIGPWPGRVIANSGASPLHSLSVSQQARDRVRLTLYGFTNQLAWAYLLALQDATLDGSAPFGFANSPIPIDEKRTQTEIAAIAQKKILEIVANYDQGAADAVARRLILAASLSSVQILGGVSILSQGALVQRGPTMSAAGTIT